MKKQGNKKDQRNVRVEDRRNIRFYKVHFIGIGGIGISALAQYYLKTGHQVSGSDLAFSEITDFLEKQGAKIFIGEHKYSNLGYPSKSKIKKATPPLLPEAKAYQKSKLPQVAEQSSLRGRHIKNQKLPDLVIYSPAVKPNNPELKKAKQLKIRHQSYPEALGELTKKYFTIAVSGTHGKSTTTAMIAKILIEAGLDPTVIIGAKLKEFGNSNFWMGKTINYKLKTKNYLVVEADEHFGSFLNYWPKIIVLTNIEADHLDYYKNFSNLLKTFKKYVSHLPKNGYLVANKDDKNIHNIFSTAVENILWFSLGQVEAKKIKNILKVPGEHNVYNALAALTVARILKIPDKVSFKALGEYKGIWRRFEEKTIKLKTINYKLISDYAHHPTEIRATLKAAREKYARKKIWCVFQPHQYQRTYYFFNDFVKVFTESIKFNWVDKLILIDIYDVAGREEKEIKKRVSSKKLVAKIKDNLFPTAVEKVLYAPAIEKVEKYLKENLKGKETVIIMGAGDIYRLVRKLETGK